MSDEISDGQMMNLGAKVMKYKSDADFYKAECARLREALEEAQQVICENLPIENCSCHINPPCSACVDGPPQAKSIGDVLAAFDKRVAERGKE